jgi:hypothetical protein
MISVIVAPGQNPSRAVFEKLNRPRPHGWKYDGKAHRCCACGKQTVEGPGQEVGPDLDWMCEKCISERKSDPDRWGDIMLASPARG